MPETASNRHVWLVNNDIPADVADEYNQWYVDVHIPQILTVPGFVSGERLALSPVQNGAKEPELRRYLSVYEIEGDPEAAFAALREAMGSGRIEKSPVQGNVATTANFVPLAPKRIAS